MECSFGEVCDVTALAQQLEQFISLGIFIVALVLATLSAMAYRRERDRRMLVVTLAYALFSIHGLIVFLETIIVGIVGPTTVELLEHGSAILILGGLLAFFVALRK
ncbi:MAG: putative membrane protein YiaA [Haloarculaceae archaeon]|jgi:uncharacterized membrane protein YiaA